MVVAVIRSTLALIYIHIMVTGRRANESDFIPSVKLDIWDFSRISDLESETKRLREEVFVRLGAI